MCEKTPQFYLEEASQAWAKGCVQQPRTIPTVVTRKPKMPTIMRPIVVKVKMLQSGSP